MAPSDHDLMQQIRKQDADAFELLFARYQELIRRHLAQIVRDDSAAHDLLQEVFVRVWTHAEQWDGRGPFKAWLFRVATNHAISYLRSPRNRKEQSLDTPAGEEEPVASWMIAPAVSGPEFLALVAEHRAAVRHLVDRLPGDRRTVFRMVYEADMDVREVAETLGIPEGTVKSRLHYARKWLARAWNELEAEQEDD
jgi:RNA polymerase sigma-70 factor (ECF subfamily)